MLVKNVFFILITGLLFACNQKKVTTITLENTLSMDREQEVVTIPKEKIVSILDTIALDRIPVILNAAFEIIPQQLEDLDNDGIWDELITTIDFKALEKITLELKTIPKNELPLFKKYTDIHFGVGTAKPIANEVQTYSRQGNPKDIENLFFQMEGPAWENEKVGFRTYFDPRNGMDIFGKTTNELILNKTGLTSNYHKLADWGMDILKVGNSLGAGAIALKHKDSLYQITGIENTEFKILNEGPIKSTFEIKHINTQVGNQKLTITNRISILKGQWGYERQVIFSGLEPESNLVTGIVNMKPNNLASKIFYGYQACMSFGKQSENNDNLGMAILVPTDTFLKLENAPDKGDGIIKTHLVSIKTENKLPLSYYFLSGWELSDTTFKTKEGFEAMVANTAERLANPILVN